MADFVVLVNNVVLEYIKNASKGSKEVEIGKEFMQLSQAVVKKHLFPEDTSYKYHLAQPQKIISRTVAQWNKICRRMKLKPNLAHPWTIKFSWHIPLEVYECLKSLLLIQETGGTVVKDTRCVQVVKVILKN